MWSMATTLVCLIKLLYREAAYRVRCTLYVVRWTMEQNRTLYVEIRTVIVYTYAMGSHYLPDDHQSRYEPWRSRFTNLGYG